MKRVGSWYGYTEAFKIAHATTTAGMPKSHTQYRFWDSC